MINCKSCGRQTYDALPVCLPCLFEDAGFKAPHFALAIRSSPLITFRPLAFLTVLESLISTFNIREWISVKDSISIKVCEQVQQELKDPEIAAAAIAWQGYDMPRGLAVEHDQKKRYLRLRVVKDSIFTTLGHQCHYCGKPLLDNASATLDTVLPTGISHASGGTDPLATYYKSAALANLIRPACFGCNAMKGVTELRGLRLLHKVMDGRRTIHPLHAQKEHLSFRHDDSWIVNTLKDSRCGKWKRIEQHDYIMLGVLLNLSALRITTSACCQLKESTAIYQPEARTLTFRCSCCSTDGIPLFTISPGSPEEIKRHERYLREEKIYRNADGTNIIHT
jgi:hypothetical protein